MASTYTELRRGAQGNDVKALQSALSSQGYKVKDSGVFDDETLEAVKSYQQKIGQAVSGNADDATLRSLYGTAAQETGGGGYTPSTRVNSAEQYLKMLQTQKPGEYTGQYTQSAQELLGKILSRGSFQYDANSDPLYQVYKDRYQMNGQRAMQDTMGQAAALTGGYGNTYAQAAGQQQYQQYMEGLNDIVPELQQQAYAQWQGEGDRLSGNYQLLQNADDTQYGRWTDRYNRWNNEVQSAQNAYDNAYSRDYEQYSGQQSAAYSTAMSILQTGSVPSDELLGRAGIGRADAELLAAYYKKQQSGSGSGGSYYKNDTPAEETQTPETAGQTAEEIAKNGDAAMGNWMTEYEYNSRKAAAKRMGYTNSSLLQTDDYEDYISQKVTSAVDAGQITTNEGLYIINKAAEGQNERRSGTTRRTR